MTSKAVSSCPVKTLSQNSHFSPPLMLRACGASEPVICQSDFSSFPLLQSVSEVQRQGLFFLFPTYCLKTNSWLVSFLPSISPLSFYSFTSAGGVGCNVRPYGVKEQAPGYLESKKNQKTKNSIFLAMVRRWCFGSANAGIRPHFCSS